MEYNVVNFFLVSIVTFIFIGILIISEFQYYRATDIQYNYEVDTDADR